jgi:hypothetical protein
MSKELMAVFDEAATLKRDERDADETIPLDSGVGGGDGFSSGGGDGGPSEGGGGGLGGAGGGPSGGPPRKRKKDAGQPYRDTIGIGNVGRKGGDQRGGVMVRTVDLANYIYAAGGWEGVRT